MQVDGLSTSAARPAPTFVPPSVAPLVGARQDGTAGVNTSRGLLLTVMGEFMLPNGGAAWTQTLVELSIALGVREKAARQAIARTAERGWLEAQRAGRQTRWVLTPYARSQLVPGAERIYGFGQVSRVWDGRWLVLLTSVPESERATRHRMGVRLSWAGFGSLRQGIWLSPWVEQEEVAVGLLTRLGVDATSFVARLGALGSPEQVAAAAWDLPRLHAAYDDFLAETRPALRTRPKGVRAAATLTGVVHEWRRFPFLDPDLPPDLLPKAWPGRLAAQRFTKVRVALSSEAQAWWRTRESAG